MDTEKPKNLLRKYCRKVWVKARELEGSKWRRLVVTQVVPTVMGIFFLGLGLGDTFGFSVHGIVNEGRTGFALFGLTLFIIGIGRMVVCLIRAPAVIDSEQSAEISRLKLLEDDSEKKRSLLAEISSFRMAGRKLKNCKIGESQAEIEAAVWKMKKGFNKWRDSTVACLREHSPHNTETFLNIGDVENDIERTQGRNVPHKRCKRRLELHLEKLEQISAEISAR